MKKDSRFDNIACEFGERPLCSERYLEPMITEMHQRMQELKPVFVQENMLSSFYFCALYEPVLDNNAG